MKIELNKFYRTRDGRKARVICVDAKGCCPIIALVTCDKCIEELILFTDDGRFFLLGADDFRDLVSEWTEPKKQRRVFLWEWKYESRWMIHSWGEMRPNNCNYRISPLCPEGILEDEE